MRVASGSLFGLAYGDSLGRPTEFQDYGSIVATYGVQGPRELTGDPARVTDDTQMALAVGEALLAARTFTPQGLEPVLRRGFVAWLKSPDNTRSPGMTCLHACVGLADGLPWLEATQARSKGCGANMRVTPVGLMPGLSDDQRAAVAQLQAAMTHGHPTALAASELTAYAVFFLSSGVAPADILAALRERCAEQRTNYRGEWLGELWRQPGYSRPETFIAHGWDECADALDRVGQALGAGRYEGDPCRATGAGWVAEEALATALYCYLISPDEPVAVVGRAAATSGDSDSIACLAGAFAGASLGLSAWPPEWQNQIEYAERLARIGRAWD
ncbi:ADP-ribosylglycohydrolase family protein [Actinoplanes sp. TBRC 11911]|uniref:ADP-ribosylglycohydrolase family protein n=1 Tax=Actinoplanes sp. TBRC 11911 TaxID=2729386 RepID=UPI00145DE5D2|nr:ADP-ribosylglycohydrolase family protein [Actinoplanes sp. TBRC 11911]NMO49928.1 ADP-ribosylglycohydrolase family protein [Actinoplanes sp. TBRC 11911]